MLIHKTMFDSCKVMLGKKQFFTKHKNINNDQVLKIVFLGAVNEDDYPSSLIYAMGEVQHNLCLSSPAAGLCVVELFGTSRRGDRR